MAWLIAPPDDAYHLLQTSSPLASLDEDVLMPGDDGFVHVHPPLHPAVFNVDLQRSEHQTLLTLKEYSGGLPVDDAMQRRSTTRFAVCAVALLLLVMTLLMLCWYLFWGAPTTE